MSLYTIVDTSFSKGKKGRAGTLFDVSISGFFRVNKHDFIRNFMVQFWACFGAKSMYNYLGFFFVSPEARQNANMAILAQKRLYGFRDGQNMAFSDDLV